MDIGTIDYWAHNGESSLHRASPPAKLLAAGLIVAAVIVSADPVLLLVIYLAVVAVIVSTKLPAAQILLLGAYPAIFAILFAISRWNGNPVGAAVVVLKAVDAALAMLMVITTTPYPAVFAVLQRFLPSRVAEALFLTYRSIFLLLAVMGELWTALRLRGGLRPGNHRQNFHNLAMGLGLLLVRAVDLSEEIYAVMRLRGYQGRLAEAPARPALSGHDLLPLATGVLLLSLAVARRLLPGTAGGYDSYVLMAAFAGVLLALVLTRWLSLLSGGGNAWRR